MLAPGLPIVVSRTWQVIGGRLSADIAGDGRLGGAANAGLEVEDTNPSCDERASTLCTACCSLDRVVI